MDRPPPDPSKLLQSWMEWEHGDVPPGRVIANLKTGGLRELLEQWAAAAPLATTPAVAAAPAAAATPDAGTDTGAAAETWKPVV